MLHEMWKKLTKGKGEGKKAEQPSSSELDIALTTMMRNMVLIYAWAGVRWENVARHASKGRKNRRHLGYQTGTRCKPSPAARG